MEDTIKWEDFVKEHKIDVSELPENVQHKIDKFEEVYAEYEAIDDEDETAIRDLELSLTTMDNGILNDLESFVAKKKSQEPAPSPTPQAGDGGQTPPAPSAQTPPQHQASDKPSWAFWM
jgi:hypothetical protein